MYHEGHPWGNGAADSRDNDQKICPYPENCQQRVCTEKSWHKIDVHDVVDMLMWPHTINSKAQERDSKDETEDNSERLLDSELAYNLRETIMLQLTFSSWNFVSRITVSKSTPSLR